MDRHDLGALAHAVEWGGWGRGTLAEVFDRTPPIRFDGPVRYVMVTGKRDDASWGPLGAFWIAQTGETGGFLPTPLATWTGGEMAREYASALERGWTAHRIHLYWLAAQEQYPLLDFAAEDVISSLEDLRFLLANV
jgi:hypothetical protein